jgi:hypothetical protein
MVVHRPAPNPKTVPALLDTTWRMSSFEAERTESLDRKASTLAAFASVVVSLVATLGTRFLERFPQAWAVTLFLASLAALVLATGAAIAVLVPAEQLTLPMDYLERLPRWSEILKPPEMVQGETMHSLFRVIARERELNGRKARFLRWAFGLLVLGVLLVSIEAGILAGRAV